MKLQDLIRRVDELIAHGKRVLSTKFREDGYGLEWVNSGDMVGYRSACLSFIERVYGTNHPHYKEFDVNTISAYPHFVDAGIAILQTIKSEIEGGWLFSLKGLITAELFADFLEMAEHLLEQGYKDPAAVMAGSVLEEHIRQLCSKNGIDITEDKGGKQVPKKADRLNAELANANVYTKLDQKLITAWLDLRNKAAHGKYDEYNDVQVNTFLSGITEFMARVTV